MGNSVEHVRVLFDSIVEIDDDGVEYYQLDDLDRDELVQTLIEIEPVNTDQFLQIKETLTRIGIANRTKKILYQSCMILHKKGKFYICHFKELFAMDGKYTSVYSDDYARRNHIAKLLSQWNLVKIVNTDVMNIPSNDEQINVYVLPYREKSSWELKAKYNIGTVPAKRKYNE
jgi:hypothetical protein